MPTDARTSDHQLEFATIHVGWISAGYPSFLTKRLGREADRRRSRRHCRMEPIGNDSRIHAAYQDGGSDALVLDGKELRWPGLISGQR